MLTKYALVAIVVLCIAVLGFTLLVRSSLCELSIKERSMAFKAVLAYESNSISAGATPRIGCQDASSRTQFAFIKTAAPQDAAVFSR